MPFPSTPDFIDLKTKKIKIIYQNVRLGMFITLTSMSYRRIRKNMVSMGFAVHHHSTGHIAPKVLSEG